MNRPSCCYINSAYHQENTPCSYGVCVKFPMSYNGVKHVIALAVDYQNSKTYTNIRWSGSWMGWQTNPNGIPAFYKNYSSINSLIDAVNPFRTINMIGETDSWDNLQNGVYCFANTHAGADVAFGFMIQYGYQSDRVAQFAVGIRGIAKRYNIGNGWEEWAYSRF